MKALLSSLVFIHGVIHLLRFVKAFKLADVRRLSADISKTAGFFWLVASALFIVSSGLLLFNSRIWWIPPLAAVILSQILITRSWSEAKFGTVSNVMIFIPVLLAFIGTLPSTLHSRYRAEVQVRLSPLPEREVNSPESVSRLPVPVRKYLEYTGVVGKPAVTNFRAVFDGVMRNKRNGNWVESSSRHYDFLNEPARFVYSRSSVFGIPIYGFSRYSPGGVGLDLKLADIVSVADGRGDKVRRDQAVMM